MALLLQDMWGHSGVLTLGPRGTGLHTVATIDTQHVVMSCSGDSGVLALGPRGQGLHTVATIDTQYGTNSGKSAVVVWKNIR